MIPERDLKQESQRGSVQEEGTRQTGPSAGGGGVHGGVTEGHVGLLPEHVHDTM